MLLPLCTLGWSSVMNGLVQAQQGRYGEVFLNKFNVIISSSKGPGSFLLAWA